MQRTASGFLLGLLEVFISIVSVFVDVYIHLLNKFEFDLIWFLILSWLIYNTHVYFVHYSYNDLFVNENWEKTCMKITVHWINDFVSKWLMIHIQYGNMNGWIAGFSFWPTGCWEDTNHVTTLTSLLGLFCFCVGEI